MQGYTAGAVAIARAARWRPIGNERGTKARLDALRHDPVWSGTGLPRGAGAPVLLIPGWMAGERSVRPLAGFLERLGYQPAVAPVGRNLGCYAETGQQLDPWVRAQRQTDGPNPVLIGHSRGGVLAVELARRHPDVISGVITLAAPLLTPFGAHPFIAAHMLATAALGATGRPGLVRPTCPAGACCQTVRDNAAATVGVPLTSIIARNDGIIGPAAGRHPDAEVVTVDASHSGILADATTYQTIATELARLTGANNRVAPEPRPSIRAGRADA